ncbi:MAG: NADH-quinone oxidoreductase subunit J [Ruminococcaceae bacterium]|nr:NADH-quinone oxidoreductase subunit J [Oscillospiraceae bacterium]
MELTKLSEIMRKAGVVGAGGAGFPSYAKLNMAADTIILNCAECEPLLKLHRQMLATYASEIMETLEEIADTLEASQVIIAVKHAYTEAIDAVKANLSKCPKTKIGLLPEIYPAGDEVVTIYETTGRVVNPGALPITVGCIVYNVETIYNVYRAWKENAPVTHKYITVAGEVKNPCTFKAPLGITYGELIKMAGGETHPDTLIVAGGPMTGRLAAKSDVVTKTSNAILVMPRNAYIVQKRTTPLTIDVKRAMAACCQCRYCTDLCSRNLIGHPIEPHKIMRAVASGNSSDLQGLIGAFSCSSCGLCEMFACGQGLNPRTLIGELKGKMRAGGIMPPKGLEADSVDKMRDYKRVPMSKLISRLGLAKYDVEAPILDTQVSSDSLKIMLSQSIGVPSAPCVKAGDRVKAGDVLGTFDESKLGTAVHSPVNGTVKEVTDKFIIVEP